MASALYAAVAFLALFLYFSRLERQADWLTVEATSPAFAGRTFEMRITLRNVPEPTFLFIDLSGFGFKREERGKVGYSRPSGLIENPGTFTYTFRVPEDEGLGYIGAMIHTTPTGEWEERSAVADTELVPVRFPSESSSLSRMKRLKVFPGASVAEESRIKSRKEFDQVCRDYRTPIILRAYIAVILFAAGIACGRFAWGAGHRADGNQVSGRIVWSGMSLLMFLASLAELFEIQKPAISMVRVAAKNAGIYWARRSVQAFVVSASAAAGLMILLLLIREWKRDPGKRRWQWTALGLLGYFFVAGVSLLSFHYTDALGGTIITGISIYDMAKTAFVSLALAGAIASFRNTKRPSHEISARSRP